MELIRVRVVCPFCKRSRPFVGMGDRTLVTPRDRLHVYECACGAVAVAAAGAILGEPSRLETARARLCAEVLGVPPDRCRMDANTVRHHEPPICLLWAKGNA